MTKTEYSKYLSSEHWKSLRTAIVEDSPKCEKCAIPRWLAEIVYDQDLHVHHLTYKNLGHEEFEDLQVLCRRCHDIETFGKSDLKSPKRQRCECCGRAHWDRRSYLCQFCECLFDMPEIQFCAFNKHPYRDELVVDRILSDVVMVFSSQKDGYKELSSKISFQKKRISDFRKKYSGGDL